MRLGFGLSLVGLQPQFNPSVLFAAGDQGVWFDPSDFSTMFQDSAGTTPVTATGQAVGKINDKSGRGNHATQATAGSRPTLQQDASGFYYLSFDGADDSLATASVNFTATNKVSIFAGVNKQSDVATQVILELSADASASPAFNLLVPTAALYRARFTGTVSATIDSNTAAAPASSVVTALGDISAPSQVIRTNGGSQVATAVSMGTGNFSGNPLNIGRRNNASLPFNGRLYGLVIVGTAVDTATVQRAERYVGSKMGIAL